jgi:hypothetical protein
MNVVALRALKRAQVETHALRHDASEHHVSMALWTGGALDVDVDAFGQGMRLWHDASLKEAGAQHSLSPVCACEGSAVIKQLWVLRFRFAVQY